MQIIAIVVYVYTEVRISMHKCTYNSYSVAIMLIMTTYFLKQVATSNLCTQDNKGNNSYTRQYYDSIDKKEYYSVDNYKNKRYIE